MAWEGKSPGEICAQLNDRNRNGGRDLALLHEHRANFYTRSELAKG